MSYYWELCPLEGNVIGDRNHSLFLRSKDYFTNLSEPDGRTWNTLTSTNICVLKRTFFWVNSLKKFVYCTPCHKVVLFFVINQKWQGGRFPHLKDNGEHWIIPPPRCGCGLNALRLCMIILWDLTWVNILFFSQTALLSCVSASEDFFDSLTVEQEFMTGVDTDKVWMDLLN